VNWFLGLDAVVRRAIVLVGLGLLLIVVGLTVGYCSERDNVRKAEAGTTLADSRTASASDASDTRDTVEGQVAAINANVKAGTDEIRNAPDDASRDRAALRSLCRVDRSASPDCRLFDAGPR
jgi:hypothetical protein